MTKNNKILTVSYGTFSCTLEGFDDSFGTMQAIAEYFRDLAGDDRYFGAEPPQPDVDMLARIAEREIARRVDAREHEGKFVLSAEQAEKAARSSESIIPPDTRPAEVDDMPPTEPASQPVADVASTTGPQSTASDTIDVQEDDTPETGDAGPVDAGAAQDAAVSRNPEGQSTPPTASLDSAAEAFFAQPIATAPSTGTAPLTTTVTKEETFAPDSIAAKLQRIRAVVSQSEADAEDDDMFGSAYFEEMASGQNPVHTHFNESEDEDNSASKAVITDAVLDIEALQDAEDDLARHQDTAALGQTEPVAHEAENAPQTQTEEDRFARTTGDMDDPTSVLTRFDDETVLDTNTSYTLDPTLTEDVQEDDVFALLDALTDYAQSASQDETAAQDLAERPPEAPVDGADLETLETTEADTSEPAPVVTTSAPRALVLKVKRADIDAAIENGALEEISEASHHAAMSGAEKADARVKDPADQYEWEEPDVDAAQAIEAKSFLENAEALEDLASQAAVEDDDVSRLMAEAESQMGEPEGSSRRSAFAHLKAAVIAKKADKEIGKEDTDKDDAYRSDLASVVKPRRPAARGSETRPESARPAPLKLVAEQRVDIDAVPTGPVRPRRVATREDPSASDTENGFEAYASELGAHDLPELLEAAASYLSFVEGREQFSRPQLMTKVRQVEKDDFSREDGLRSFGQLLRAGKIEKIKGGRFSVTTDIGYRPEHRAAG